MNTRRNTSSPISGTRLVAFLVVLVVGLALGWWNGSNGDLATTDTARIQTQTDETDAEATASDDLSQHSDDSQGAPDAEEPAADPAPDTNPSGTATDVSTAPTRGPTVEEDGWYTSKEEVALYIHTYGRLPGNFISKTKARDRGWEASKGNLDEVCPGMSIGGSRFYNDDGLLPDKSGRRWTECDINYQGGYRGSERIVFSNDGLIFYTADHYQTFEQLY